MGTNIGETIATLRRQKGITQETLANRVGVSAAAVSKWETGASCPDVTLLVPLARALGTDVNGLLSFTAQPTDAEITACINEIAGLALSGEAEAVRRRIDAAWKEYPGCAALAYQFAATLLSLPMWTGGSVCEADRARAEALLEEVVRGDDPHYSVRAAHMLVGLYVGDGALDRAEALLKDLSEPVPDAAMVRALVAQKHGDIENAKRILQTALLHASNQVQACLMRLASAPFAEAEEERSIARVYQACSEAIGYPFSMSDMLFMEAYLRLGDKKHAAEHLRRLAAELSDPPEAPLSALLFSTFSKDVSQTGRLVSSMRRTFKKLLAEDAIFAPLRDMPEYETALTLLSASEPPEKKA